MPFKFLNISHLKQCLNFELKIGNKYVTGQSQDETETSNNLKNNFGHFTTIRFFSI